jgi:hypothetical protein
MPGSSAKILPCPKPPKLPSAPTRQQSGKPQATPSSIKKEAGVKLESSIRDSYGDFSAQRALFDMQKTVALAFVEADADGDKKVSSD